MIHMASVWVPFTSESKEAIADYDEIRKEMKLALQECGRKLGTYLRRRKRMQRESERRSVFERYIGEVAKSCEHITGSDAKRIYYELLKQAKRKTAEADQQLDDEGKVIDEVASLAKDEQVVIVASSAPEIDEEDDTLFGKEPQSVAKKRKITKKKKKHTRKRTSKR